MSVIDDALRAIRQRLDKIEREAEQLRAAIAALENSGPRANNPRRNTTRAAPPLTRATLTRAPRGENRRKILDAIKVNAKTASEIEQETGIPAHTAGTTLSKLVRDGRVKKATRGYIAVRS